MSGRDPGDSTGMLRGRGHHRRGSRGVPKVVEDQEHAEQEAEVADPVDDEGLLAGVRRALSLSNQKPMSR